MFSIMLVKCLKKTGYFGEEVAKVIKQKKRNEKKKNKKHRNTKMSNSTIKYSWNNWKLPKVVFLLSVRNYI